jgi:hypothetical protein
MARELIVAYGILTVVTVVALQSAALAHDVPGQPSHVLSDDPDAPPSVQVETHIGPYHVILMATPASPKPGERGTLILDAARIDDGQPFIGKVTFKALDDSVFSGGEELIGVQYVRDDVYRQGFLFREAGDYRIRAEFEPGGEPFTVELPLTIGTPSRIGTIGAVGFTLLVALVAVNLMQRRRLQRVRTATSSAG